MSQAGLGQARAARCRRHAAIGASELLPEQCSGVVRVVGVFGVFRVEESPQERGQGVAGGKGQVVDLGEDLGEDWRVGRPEEEEEEIGMMRKRRGKAKNER